MTLVALFALSTGAWADDANTVDVTWNATTKQATFTMPAGDVELQVEYCPEAELVDGTDVAPAAADGTIIVGTESPLVTAPDAVSQGTLMYLVTTTNEQPTSTEGFSADVPTAADVTTPGTQFVWYYIKGDTNHNDSPIFRTPIEVNVLKDEFDITFNALNTNTIEDGKATVKVDGTAKTLDADHQVKGVKIGKPVTVEAKTGYKFRKVEVKKGDATPAPAEGPTLAQTLTTANMTVKVYYTYNDMNNTCEFLSNGDGTYTFQSGTGLVGGNNQKAKALVVENGKLVFKQNFYETLVKLWNQVGFSVTFDTSENTYSIWKGSNETITGTLSKVEVNGTQIAVTQQ